MNDSTSVQKSLAALHDCPLSGADPCRTLYLLAQPFKDHPDFDAEWLQD
jgi:hypothetical protein